MSGVAYADGLPPNQPGQHNNFDLEAHAAGAISRSRSRRGSRSRPSYVPTLGLKLIEGRLLDERDAQPQNLLVRRRRSRVGAAVLPERKRRRQAAEERRLHRRARGRRSSAW